MKMDVMDRSRLQNDNFMNNDVGTKIGIPLCDIHIQQHKQTQVINIKLHRSKALN